MCLQRWFDQLFRLAQRITINDRPAIEDANVRAKLATWYCQEAGLKYTGYRKFKLCRYGANLMHVQISKLVL